MNKEQFYIGSWRVKLNLAPLGMPKWVWSFMNQYIMFFVQTSTLPPRMHHKLTKHGRFCKQNNQLPTKTHVELKDNSNITKDSSTTYTSHKLCYQCTLETFESNIKIRYQQWSMFPWFENIHCYNNLRERLQDGSKWKQFINASYYERRILLNVEITNLGGGEVISWSSNICANKW